MSTKTSSVSVSRSQTAREYASGTDILGILGSKEELQKAEQDPDTALHCSATSDSTSLLFLTGKTGITTLETPSGAPDTA